MNIKKITLIFIVFALTVGIASYVYVGSIEQKAEDEKIKIKAQAVTIANGVAQFINEWKEQVDKLSKSSTLQQAAINGEVSLKDWLETQQKPENMMALKVLPLGHVSIDKSENPPLGYAGLDMLRTVEQRQTMLGPEVHMLGDSKQHLAIAAPVMANKKIVAIMLAVFDVNSLKNRYKLMLKGDSYGWYELKQNALVIGGIGDAGFAKNNLIDTVFLPKTQWRIVAYRDLPVAPIATGDIVYYSGYLVVLLILVGALIGLLVDKDPKRSIMKRVNGRKGTGETTFQKAVESEQEDSTQDEVMLDTDPIQTPNPMFLEAGSIEVSASGKVPASIFRAYDIRGIVEKTLTEAGVFEIAKAIGSEVRKAGGKKVVIARDGRLHSVKISESLAKGLQAVGCDIVDIGQVPTPVLYFSTCFLEGAASGVMVTGSHNPPEYNGLKIVVEGDTLSGESIQGLYQRIQQEDYEEGEGGYDKQMVLPDYIGTISADVRLGRMMKVVVDCGNGVAGEAAPMLLSTLGCEIIPLFCEIDGRFPNHHPDPSKPENLQVLIEKVQSEGADIGLAFDGDGDRLGVVDSAGNIIWPDRQMMLYAADVLSRQAGADIVFDVKCSKNLAKEITKHGGKAVMAKTGHSLIKAKMKQVNAELAGEMSGHIFFKERWYGFDDGLYTAARLLEILSAEFRSSAEIFAELPDSINTPEINVMMSEGENFSFMDKLLSRVEFDDAKIITIDGLRVEFMDGWGLVRASNTTPSLVLRFEADDEQALQRIQQVIKGKMLVINPDLELPF